MVAPQVRFEAIKDLAKEYSFLFDLENVYK